MIETEEHIPVSKIFEEKGEAYFREKETEVIKRLLEEPKGKIIATGGGLPVWEGNAEILKKLGTVIYLKVETETLMQRLSGSKGNRPLLQNGDLREKIETMLAVRGPVYEACADVILQTDNMSFYEIICRIEKILAKQL